MKPSSRNLVIISVFIIAVIILGILLISHNHKGTSSNNSTNKSPYIVPHPTSVAVNPTQTVTSPTQYPSSFRAKVRSDFINNCSAVIGHQYVSVCNCAADYLAGNYNDAQLTQFYLQYHSSSQIPNEIKAAMKSCSSVK